MVFNAWPFYFIHIDIHILQKNHENLDNTYRHMEKCTIGNSPEEPTNTRNSQIPFFVHCIFSLRGYKISYEDFGKGNLKNRASS